MHIVLPRPSKNKLTNAEIESAIDEALSKINESSHSNDFIEYDEAERVIAEFDELVGSVYSKKRNILFRLFGDRELKEKITFFETAIDGFPKSIETHNDYLASKLLKEYSQTKPKVESYELDEQQKRSIVYDVRNRLVVAGAGTGKTTTIVGLVKYLLSKGVPPENILLLSFTNASVDELKDRIIKETQMEIMTNTFHRLGLGIIADAEGKRPNITHLDPIKFISDTIRLLCDDRVYANLVNDYVRFGIHQPEEESDQYKEIKIHTMKGEKVKSFGEKEIADYLFTHDIPYVYEESYEYDVADEKHSQYHPDFHITGTNVYIEYFGIDKNGKVAPFISSINGDPSKEYNESMKWKEQCHKEHGTRLIRLYFHQRCDCIMIDELERQLNDYRIEIKLLSTEEIVLRMDEDNTFSRLAFHFATTIALLKSKNMTLEKLSDSKSFKMPWLKRYLRILQPIFDSHQDRLRKFNEIDFEDMLNHASDLIDEGRFVHNFSYVIVDEYQDISTSRYRLLKSLRKVGDYHLFCVGDDWQSIYRFNGSDIGYILDFERYWGKSKTFRIERTYRFTGRLLECSSRFILKNPKQLRKELIGSKNTDSFVNVLNVERFGEEGLRIENELLKLPSGSNVFVLGRYNFDLSLMDNAKTVNNPDGSIDLKFESRDDLNVKYMTIHGSKGLQADYVFIINCRARGSGFPNTLADPPLLAVLMETGEDYAFAEERRLFYVALTRAKKGVYLVLRIGNVSPFVMDLLTEPGGADEKKPTEE